MKKINEHQIDEQTENLQEPRRVVEERTKEEETEPEGSTESSGEIIKPFKSKKGSS